MLRKNRSQLFWSSIKLPIFLLTHQECRKCPDCRDPWLPLLFCFSGYSEEKFRDYAVGLHYPSQSIFVSSLATRSGYRFTLPHHHFYTTFHLSGKLVLSYPYPFHFHFDFTCFTDNIRLILILFFYSMFLVTNCQNKLVLFCFYFSSLLTLVKFVY